MKTLIQLIFTWLLICIALRCYLIVAVAGEHKLITSGTTFREMAGKSAYFDDGLYRCRVKVERTPFSVMTMMLLDEMEISDSSGQRITVIGSFPTFNPKDTVNFTGVFKQVMNNSLIQNCCIFLYVKAE